MSGIDPWRWQRVGDVPAEYDRYAGLRSDLGHRVGVSAAHLVLPRLMTEQAVEDAAPAYPHVADQSNMGGEAGQQLL